MVIVRQLTKREKLVLLAGAIPWLASILLLAIALSERSAYAFAIGWPVLQLVGYAGALRFAKGEVDHPLVHTQVVLHWLVLVLLVAMLARGMP